MEAIAPFIPYFTIAVAAVMWAMVAPSIVKLIKYVRKF